MTKPENEKLFVLLSQFFPNRQLTKELKLAWTLALEPYSYADVKTAVVEYVRNNKYFPDIFDITSMLPENGEKEERHISHASMKNYVYKLIDCMKRKTSVSQFARENNLTWHEAEFLLGNKE